MCSKRGQKCSFCRDLCNLIQFLFMVFLIRNGVYADERFMLSGTTGSWSDAESNCRSARASLALVDTPARMQTFLKDVAIAPGVPLWVDRYVGYTSIVTIEGCYSNTSLVYKKITVMEDNTLVRCMTQCKNSLFIGMQGPVCYCVDSVPAQSRPVPGVQCGTLCPGDTARFSSTPVSQCGNVDRRFNTVSLYRKVRPGEINLDKNLPNEGECISYNIRSRSWQTDNCTNPRLFVCDQKPCFQQSPLMCMRDGQAAVPWITARARCDGSNLRLATVNFTTDDYFFNKLTTQFPVYWTGLHRQEVTIWGNDISSGEVARSDKCVAMIKSPNGQWTWFLDWCMKPHRYACLGNTSTTTTTASSVTLPTTNSGTQTGSPTPRRTRPTTTIRVSTVTINALPVNVTSAATTSHPATIGFPLLLVLVSPLTIAMMLL